MIPVKSVFDGNDGTRYIRFNVRRRNANDTVATGFRLTPPFFIVLVLRLMDCSVHLNNQMAFRAKEVYDKWADCLLAAELYAIELPVPQHIPQPLLRMRRLHR